MKKGKILSAVLSLTVLTSALSLTAFAKTFPDVENDATVAWAKESINKMTDAGYIKGYEDGTFQAKREVSKIESLILMSRMLGVEENAYKTTVQNALAEHETTVKKFNTTYVNELAFLLYCDVINETDLNTYASNANANTPLFRYQAAILVSKLMGAEKEIQASGTSTTTYSDDTSIPANAKAYVAYVTKQGVMNGMGNDASGKPEFSPNTTLNRGQMATILARLIDTLERGTEAGTLVAYNTKEKQITLEIDGKEYIRDYGENAVFKKDGKDSKASALVEGSEIRITNICEQARLIETISPTKVERLYGKIAQISESAKGQQLTIKDAEDESNQATYTIAENCTFTSKGTNKLVIGDLKNNNFVYCELTGGQITKIDVQDKTSDVSGTLSEIKYDTEDHVYIVIEEKDGGEEITYDVSGSGARITRNGSTAEYRELAEGDSVTLTLTYGKVTKVVATSKSDDVTGTLEEIIIAKSPRIVVTVNGKSQEYKVYSDAEIIVNDDDASIYDLRPGSAVSLKLDSNEVRKIVSTTSATAENGEIDGEVTGINTSYNVITVEDEKGNSQSIYYNSKTAFLKKDGTSVAAKSIVKGNYISATGSTKNGIFEASIVIVK